MNSISHSQLDNYKNELPTRSCFLDGRYINIVLADIPEFHKQVIKIDLEFGPAQGLMYEDIRGSAAISEGMNIVRVVIETPSSKHSALVWIDTRDQSIVFSDVVDNPTPEIDHIVDKLLQDFYGHLGYSYHRDVATVSMDTRQDDLDCDKFGYCNAYVIKQVLDYVSDINFDPSEIRRFAGAIEKNYAHLLDPNTELEEEYRAGRGGGRGGSRGYGGRRGYGGYGRRGYGGYGAGLGLGLGVLGGVALGSAIASQQPYYGPYYPPPYPYYPYGYGY